MKDLLRGEQETKTKRGRSGFADGSLWIQNKGTAGANLLRTYTEPRLGPERWEKVAEMLGKKCSPISGVEGMWLGGETIKDAMGDTQ